MSTETNFLPGSNQYNFLRRDLESVDRMKTPFFVFQGHRPMYTTSFASKDAPLRERMFEHLEPLLVKNKVTLVLWGHVHRYDRFCPMKNFTCGSMGQKGEDWEALPVPVVIGMGGQDWQPKWEPRPDHPDDPVFPQPKRSLYRAGEFGYTRLVATREKLRLSFVGNHDGEVHDMVEILASGKFLMAVKSTMVKLVHSIRLTQNVTHFHIISGVSVSWCSGFSSAMFSVLFHMLGYREGTGLW
ncbi:Detected protein of unknown function [Hibiscus syriacus]|uniref:Uncharacterized protein n=1 Tax=Hibiscus syriacus TaxID=106335 RepID=A0A6A3BSG7_HIBSY|nr:Detected protein of unknown function [Hibiscus syriacus]